MVKMHKILHKKLVKLHLDRKNARQARERAAPLYHIHSKKSIGKLHKN
jgi:hypothetical protein